MILDIFPITDLKMSIIVSLYYEPLPLSGIYKKLNKSPQLVFKTIKSIPIITKKNSIYYLEENFKETHKKFIETYILEKNLGKYYIILDLIKKYYEPKEMILFGSYAKGTFNKTSDIDIYVISDVNQSKNLELRRKLSEEFKKEIQIICVKPKNHLTQKDKYKDLYKEITKNNNGIKID